jgi:hypothetical protein
VNLATDSEGETFSGEAGTSPRHSCRGSHDFSMIL